MNAEEWEEIEKKTEEFASLLAEHVDTVRIFVTKHGDGSKDSSASLTTGRGNFYAQIGHIKEWIKMQDQYAKEKAKTEWEG